MPRFIQLATIVIMLMPVLGAAQDFDKGVAAFEAGDFVDALTELWPLAADGDAEAQYYLGLLNAAQLDWPAANSWFNLASEQGHPQSLKVLAGSYRHGVGIEYDASEALRLYHRAAMLGDPEAQHLLGIMHRNGEGTPQDYQTAYLWFNLAAANSGYLNSKKFQGKFFDETSARRIQADAIRLRDDIAAQMTPADISEAQRRARVCMASNYQDCD